MAVRESLKYAYKKTSAHEITSRREDIIIGNITVASPSIVIKSASSLTFPHEIASLILAPEREPSLCLLQPDRSDPLRLYLVLKLPFGALPPLRPRSLTGGDRSDPSLPTDHHVLPLPYHRAPLGSD